jgi:flagella basal body P-ring formation protein FlgA
MQSARSDDVVVVNLRTDIAAPEKQLLIGDIAGITGADAATRDMIGGLDIAEVRDPAAMLSISKEQVSYRIQIAGLEPGRFQVAGPETVRVIGGSGHKLQDDILAAAKERVRLSIPGEDRDVFIQLDGRMSGVPPRLPPDAKPRLEARLESIGVPLGHIQVAVSIVLHEQVVATVPVRLLVQLRQNVAMTTRRVEKGEALAQQNVFFAPLTSERLESYVTDPKEITGQRAKRALPAGQPLTKADFEPSPSDSPLLVQQQRLVKMIAQLGGLQIEAMGEALQDGHAGDLVRVRNIDSKIVVVGRVIDRATVQVAY